MPLESISAHGSTGKNIHILESTFQHLFRIKSLRVLAKAPWHDVWTSSMLYQAYERKSNL